MTEINPNARIESWADPAMFSAEPVDVAGGPKVYLLEMTHDPLGSVAALSAMYTGKVTRSKEDVTDAERAHHLREMQLTKLKTPLEAVKLHFMIEGVTRAFTHQLVRNRTSAYAQESMRFAVKEGMPVALPPSLEGTKSANDILNDLAMSLGRMPTNEDMERFLSEDEKNRIDWDDAVNSIKGAYNRMINRGMPAEDARGIAPTNVLTRINWVTDLRTLIDVLGVRLCTQAQFEWRLVATLIANSIADRYVHDVRFVLEDSYVDQAGSDQLREIDDTKAKLAREYQSIASLFRPICYFTGKCEFQSDADRACSIRSRVQANHEIARPSSEWDKEYDVVDPTEVGMWNPNTHTVRGQDNKPVFIGVIQPAEWMLDPAAAR